MQIICGSMQNNMQKYVKIRTVLAKTCRNMPVQEICRNMLQKYAVVYALICQNMQFKYAITCKFDLQNICENIRVYVFAYGAYICTPHWHFADD